MEQEPKFEQSNNYEQTINKFDEICNISDDQEFNLQAEKLIESKLSELQTYSLKKDNLGQGYEPHQGFISKDTEIRRKTALDGFRLDDPSIYSDLLTNIREQKQDPYWQSKTPREYMSTAINYTIAKYFGGWKGNDQEGRRFYEDRSTSDSQGFSMAELKGKNLAVCVERAALAQNLYTFSGLNSEFTTGECQLDPNGKPEFHAFNLITNENGKFIAEVTNPSLILNSEDKMVSTTPIFYPLTPEQSTSFENGESVTVKHIDYKTVNDITETINSQRVYKKS